MAEPAQGWWTFVANPETVTGIFGNAPPSLDAVHLQHVLFAMRGFDIGVDLPEIPPSAPARWRERGNDACQVRLHIMEAHEFALTGQPPEGPARIEISRGRIRIAASNEKFLLTASYWQLEVGFTPYNSYMANDHQISSWKMR